LEEKLFVYFALRSTFTIFAKKCAHGKIHQHGKRGIEGAILAMLARECVNVNTTKFQNDISIVKNRDDVLTVLIHLGYLSYDRQRKDCGIPNFEVAGEMQNAVEDTNWTNIVRTNYTRSFRQP